MIEESYICNEFNEAPFVIICFYQFVEDLCAKSDASQKVSFCIVAVRCILKSKNDCTLASVNIISTNNVLYAKFC